MLRAIPAPMRPRPMQATVRSCKDKLILFSPLVSRYGLRRSTSLATVWQEWLRDIGLPCAGRWAGLRCVSIVGPAGSNSERPTTDGLSREDDMRGLALFAAGLILGISLMQPT